VSYTLFHLFPFVFQKQLKSLIEHHYKEHADYVLRDPVLFGDYKNTLEESEPRLYEDIQDYEAAKALFLEVRLLVYMLLNAHE